MEDPNSTLLPYILETLSRTPELCDTFENLCKNVHLQLIQEQNGRYANVRLAIQRALNVGQSLGIITLNHETIRVPFNFRQNKNYRNMNHFQMNDKPITSVASMFGGTAQQKQIQNNQQNKSAQQKKEPERSQKAKKDEEEEAKKYVRQLELDDSDFSLESTTSDRDTRTRSRSRSTSRKRPRERSNSRPRARRPYTRSRGRYGRSRR